MGVVKVKHVTLFYHVKVKFHVENLPHRRRMTAPRPRVAAPVSGRWWWWRGRGCPAPPAATAAARAAARPADTAAAAGDSTGLASTGRGRRR